MDETIKKCLHTLGLPENAGIDDIKQAYQRISKDIQSGNISLENVKEIMWSYDYLIKYLTQNTQFLNEENSYHHTRKPEFQRYSSDNSYTSKNETKKSAGKFFYLFIIFLIIVGIFIFLKNGLIDLGRVNKTEIDTAPIVKKIKPAIVTIKIGDLGTGSGFAVSKDGYIVTNAHVMREKSAVAIFSDGFQTEINLVYLDEERDFALVKAEIARNYYFLQLGDSNKCSEGDTVIAAGAPLSFEFSFTKGIISSTNRSLPFLSAKLIQTDAAINPGNSGGPLINGNGEVIGINFLKLANMAVEGIGFAISINDVKNYINNKQLMSDAELTSAIARAEKKLDEYNQMPNDEINKMKDKIIEEQWERERRRKEFNEKVEAANRDLQEQKEKVEKQLYDEAEQLRRRQRESVEVKRKSLTDCIQNAVYQHQNAWNEQCKKFNQQDNCSLPANIAAIFEQRHHQVRNECYRLNPQ